MNADHFDSVTKLFAGRLTRRRALAQGGAGLAAGVIATAALQSARAQDGAAPAAEPEASFANSHTLYVQSFQAGALAPAGGEGRFTLTLEQGLGQTIFFADRPNRDVGTIPTAQFIEGLGFTPENPPNAALLVEQAPGETNIAVVELFNPVVDPDSPGVTYEIAVLADWEQRLDMEFQEAPADLTELGESFGAVHLFIDGIADCPERTMHCYTGEHWKHGVHPETIVGTIPSADHDGYCYSWSNVACFPCQPWGQDPSYWADQCNQRFSACNGACHASNFCSRDAPLGNTYCEGSYEGWE